VAGRQQGQAGSQRQVAPHFKRGQQANSNRCANASSSSHHHTTPPTHHYTTPLTQRLRDSPGSHPAPSTGPWGRAGPRR
jgi:hypothetical protein